MTDRLELRTRIRARLGDEVVGSYKWSDTQINQWINDAIGIISSNFPLRASVWIHGAAGHEYSLPTGIRSVLSVEYPIGEDPPHYLYRKPRTAPGFFEHEDYYDVIWKQDGSQQDLLVCSEEVAVAKHIAVEYTYDHALFSDDATDTTVPEQYLELVVLYVRLCAYQELAMTEAQNPDPTTLILNTMELNVSRAERQYNARLNQLKAAAAESGRAQWGMDKWDRVY